MTPAPTGPSATFSRVRARWVLLALLLLATGLYLPSLANGFPMDDFLAKAENDGQPNAMVSTLRPLGDYFSAHYWEGVFGRSRLFRPITILSYALTHAWFGQGSVPANEAIPHHAINLVLHALVAWLLYRLLRRLRLDRGVALIGTAAFALHGLHSEVVASIVGRAELLAFGFGGLGTWLLATQRPLSRPALWSRSAIAAACFFCALCSKETGVVWLPIAAVVVALFGGQRIAPGSPPQQQSPRSPPLGWLLGWRLAWLPVGAAILLAVVPVVVLARADARKPTE